MSYRDRDSSNNRWMKPRYRDNDHHQRRYDNDREKKPQFNYSHRDREGPPSPKEFQEKKYEEPNYHRREDRRQNNYDDNYHQRRTYEDQRSQGRTRYSDNNDYPQRRSRSPPNSQRRRRRDYDDDDNYSFQRRSNRNSDFDDFRRKSENEYYYNNNNRRRRSPTATTTTTFYQQSRTPLPYRTTDQIETQRKKTKNVYIPQQQQQQKQKPKLFTRRQYQEEEEEENKKINYDNPLEFDYNTKFFKIYSSPNNNKEQKTWISKKEFEARKKMFSSTINLLERYKFEKRVILKNIPFINNKFKSIYLSNPHLREVFINREQFYQKHKPLTLKDRIIDFRNSPRTPYRRRGKITHTVDHWGQRKLLLSEIEFLTRFFDFSSSSKNNIIIYAGAAPGKHIPFLIQMFPKIYHLILIDPSKFDESLYNNNEKITIINDFFTDELAIELNQKYINNENNVLFISDVRSEVIRPHHHHQDKNENNNSTKEEQSKKVDGQVENDMKLQQKWFNLLKPNAACFKFRLSYYPGKTNYLIGDVYFPIFTGKSSSECRIMISSIDNHKQREYDHEIYENILFHFHSRTRTSHFNHNIEIIEGQGLDHCYDCSAEIFVLQQYFQKILKDNNENNDIKEKIIQLSKDISKHISKKRTLSLDCFKSYQQFFDDIL